MRIYKLHFLLLVVIFGTAACEPSAEDIRQRMLSRVVVLSVWEPAGLFIDTYLDCGTWEWVDPTEVERLVTFVRTHIAAVSEDPSGDHWKFPFETWEDGSGDCEDHAFFYCALLRFLGYAGDLLLIYGYMCGEKHIWVEMFPDTRTYGYLLDITNALTILDIERQLSREAYGRTAEIIAVVP